MFFVFREANKLNPAILPIEIRPTARQAIFLCLRWFRKYISIVASCSTLVPRFARSTHWSCMS
jgi:hypothetical protein